jgi:hypothetical protein
MYLHLYIHIFISSKYFSVNVPSHERNTFYIHLYSKYILIYTYIHRNMYIDKCMYVCICIFIHIIYACLHLCTYIFIPGKYYSVNVPLQEGIDDASYETVFKPVIEKVCICICINICIGILIFMCMFL